MLEGMEDVSNATIGHCAGGRPYRYRGLAFLHVSSIIIVKSGSLLYSPFMLKKILLTYAVCWAGLVVIAILNGAIREKVYGPSMRELSAHQVSTLIGLILFGGYIWGITGAYPIESSILALAIGGMWLVMTLIFEFVFGHWVMKHPWRRLFQDYSLFKGRVWLLVLIWTAIAPYVFYRIRS